MNKSTLYTFLLIIFSHGCEVKPAEINYGTDSCHFCKMTIVDQSHAAQVVTSKGKAFKYDAIECMAKSIRQWKSDELAYVLVTDFMSPAKLIDARSAHYLISEAVPSPMGANLSAFESEGKRDQFLRDTSDKTVSWDELQSNNY